MIMGKIISRSKYEYYEYVTAVLISIGMTAFLLGSKEDAAGELISFEYYRGIIPICL